MKNIKKILAMLMATAMVLSSGVVAFGNEQDPQTQGSGDTSDSGTTDSGTTATTPTGALTPDTELIVGGLDVGDQVKFYKLIKWVPGTGWAWADGVETAAADTSDDKTAITLPALTTITGYMDTTKNPPVFVPGAISAADGGKLAQVAQRLTAADTETVATGATSVKYEKPAYEDGATDAEKEAADAAYMGLYVALVDPAKAEYLYNPIFVAADYNPDSTNTNSITVAEGTLSYSDEALAKKEKVTLTKTSGTPADDTTAEDKMYDIAVGDTIPFTINSVVPAFSTSYQNPQYEISDTMDTGLELLTTPAIVVKVIESTASPDDKADDTKWTTLYATGNAPEYELVAADPATAGFTVKLKSDYLKDNATPKDIKVTYSAKVTAIDDTNVVQKENTATVKFSNNPGDSSSYSLIEDKTNHYTFSLDANLLGNSSWENSELVKIGFDPATGKEITQETLSNGTKAGVLEGAKFGLYTTYDAVAKTVSNLYTNNNVTPAVTGEFTSDENGKLNISGLDAGTYYLQEISAPAGYIKDTTIYEIKITPSYDTVAAGSYTNDAGILVNYDAYEYLKSYKVEVKDLTANTTITSDFTITNDGTHEKTATTSSATDETTKLKNTQGTELPSTGGVGTTMMYMFGAIFVMFAGVLLVSKRRMAAR